MWHRRLLTRWPLITALICGLYTGRVLGEWLRSGWVGAILLTLAAVLICALAAARIDDRQRLRAYVPVLLPLLAYVFYPWPHWGVALAALSTTVLGALIVAVRATEPAARPWTSDRALLATAGLVLLLFFALYTVTLAPDVLPADNGELQLVAAELGVAHPPGFALYTVLAHLATRLPLGESAAYRANLFSALTGAATVSFVFLSGWLLARRLAPALLSALALGTATTFWSQSTTANVRSLTALFAALAIFILLLIREQQRQTARARDPARAGAPALTFALFVVFSLGITHHASLLFMVLVFGLVLLWLDPDLLRQPRRWPPLLVALFTGFLPLLYFPLRAGADAHGSAPALATVGGFLEHVLALGFRGDLFAFLEPVELAARLGVMANVMSFQFHPLLLLGMAGGLLLLLWRDRTLALLLGGSFLLHTLITATYRAPQTVEYMLPAYVPATLLWAVALGDAGASSRRPQTGIPTPVATIRSLALAILIVAAGAQAWSNYGSFAALAEDRTAREYAGTILEDAPENSVILADWHWASPLWYLQRVEGRRPDLDIAYVFPTAEPYGATWARRIAETLDAGLPVVATHYDRQQYEQLPPSQPLGEAFLFRQTPLTELPPGFQPLTLTLGDQIELLGYRLADDSVAPTYESDLLLAWRSRTPTAQPLTLFTHLVGADGAIYAQQDLPARAQAEGITVTPFTLVPRPGALPGEYALMVGAYDETGGPLPDNEGNRRSRLTTVTVTPMPQPLFTDHPRQWTLEDEQRRLLGFDWDNTLPQRPRLYLHWQTADGDVTEVRDVPEGEITLPAHYGPWGIRRQGARLANDGGYYVPFGAGIIWQGQPQLEGRRLQAAQVIQLVQQFAASRPVMRDYVSSVRLIGYEADGEQWAWWDLDDTVPALGAIPTLKWVAGSTVRDPHFLTVSPQAVPGQQLGGLLTAYDAFTQQPLPILDERITGAYLGVPLGRGVVEE
ncbi:MAG: protein O-mannosyl-transferase family [Chloroflexota bacterium]